MNSQNIDFKTVSSDTQQADVVRLAHGQDGVVLVVSRTTSNPILGATTVLSSTTTTSSSSAWRILATFNQVVPAAPLWDVSTDANRKFQFVIEVPGGAINSLALRDASGEPQNLTANSPLQSFSSPRFEKQLKSPPEWITAVVDNKDCVAIPVTRKTPHRSLGPCAEGLLVRFNKDFLFLHKKNISGPVRGNNISPGHLYLTLLDGEMHPHGTERENEVFGGSPVFQFDAEVIGNKVVIVAATSSGVEVASYPAQATTSRSSKHEYRTSPLTSPTVADVGHGKVLLAALRSAGKDQQGIVIAEIRVPGD